MKGFSILINQENASSFNFDSAKDFLTSKALIFLMILSLRSLSKNSTFNHLWLIPRMKRMKRAQSTNLWQRMMLMTMKNGLRSNRKEEGKTLIEQREQQQNSIYVEMRLKG